MLSASLIDGADTNILVSAFKYETSLPVYHVWLNILGTFKDSNLTLISTDKTVFRCNKHKDWILFHFPCRTA